MLGALKEKNGDGKGQLSATRLITCAMALCYDIGLVASAYRGHFHDLAWPVVGLGIALNLAVPVQAWLVTRAGQVALAKAVKVIQEKLTGAAGGQK